MKKLLFIVVLLMSCGDNINKAELKGDFRTNYVTEDFLLYDTELYWEDIRDTILKWNPKWENSSHTRNQIAWKIYAISTCLNIDAIVYSSLIFSESNYVSSAVSPTGAVGLTQFTNIGIKEVNDQLGRRGPSFSRASSIRYFRSVIEDCISYENGIANYQDLWTFNNQKQRLLSNADHSLIYGAIYLKSLLSVAKYKLEQASMRDIYYEALRSYNNDPNVRDKYASKTLNRAIKFHWEDL